MTVPQPGSDFQPAAHRRAGGLALLVTFIWSSSFVFTKWIYAMGVAPLTVSGLRYSLAALVLLPVWWLRRRSSPAEQAAKASEGAATSKTAKAAVEAPATAAVGSATAAARKGRGAGADPPAGTDGTDRIGRRRLTWWVPLLLGLSGYAVAQGGLHLGLWFLQANEVGLILGLHNTLQVLLWSWLLLGEWPTRLQALGIACALGGILLYYYPWQLAATTLVGILPVLAAGVGYALWIVGNRRWMQQSDAVEVTVPAMAWGGGLLLAAALWLDGVPALPWPAWGLIIGLAVVNTAAAFTLWTHTQWILAAYESSIINNTMVVQVALLAYFVLGEALTLLQWAAIGLVTAATIVVQTAPHWRRRPGEADTTGPAT